MSATNDRANLLSPPSLPRQKAYETVSHYLRELILSDAVGEGMRLPPERELAERFGVSRVVIREAVRTLESDGLLKVKKGAGGGTFVCRDLGKPLATTLANLLQGGSINLSHLFELRLMLEPPAAALAAARCTPDSLGELERILEASHAAFQDEAALRALNLEFHRRLVRLAGNPLLTYLCDKVLDLLTQRISAKTSLRTSQAVVAWHVEIVAALRGGDAREVQERTAQELNVLLNLYREVGLEIEPRRPGPAAEQH